MTLISDNRISTSSNAPIFRIIILLILFPVYVQEVHTPAPCKNTANSPKNQENFEEFQNYRANALENFEIPRIATMILITFNYFDSSLCPICERSVCRGPSLISFILTYLSMHGSRSQQGRASCPSTKMTQPLLNKSNIVLGRA